MVLGPLQRTILFGSGARATLFGLLVGALLGVATWELYPSFGVEYGLVPTGEAGAIFAGAFLALAVAVSFAGSGVLGGWGVNAPLLYALAYHSVTLDGGHLGKIQVGHLLAVSLESDVQTLALIAAGVAAAFAVPGFLVGWYARVGLNWASLLRGGPASA